MAEAPEGMFDPIDEGLAAIGQLLFYDPILSGNQNISCGTCHNHDHFSADGVSLGIGEGGVGVGPKRVTHEGPDKIKKRIPRNAQALFNVGALEVFFHDGRLGASPDYGNGVNSPAEEWLPEGLDSLLAAQALFPMTSQFEMAGNPKENEVAGAIHDRIDAAWPIIAKRVRINSEYAAMFVREGVAEVSIADIGNALAAFMDAEWRSFDSPYDLGEMNAAQTRGAELFFGKAACSSCHTGDLLTDEGFHAIGLPPFGPGRTRRFDPMPRDVGRMAESDALEDAYRFRTPSLRNVELTGPYGHNGAYPTLEGIIRHHARPLESLDAWRQELARLPAVPWLQKADFIIHQDSREMARVRANIDIDPKDLSDAEIADLVAFMGALTGKMSIHGRLGKPEAVPSGLRVD
ncbi:MAG: cytochrome c peroxidase [Pseudomonadota bacterium]